MRSNPGIRWSILPIGIRSTLLYEGTFFKDDGQPSGAGEAGVFRLAGRVFRFASILSSRFEYGFERER